MPVIEARPDEQVRPERVCQREAAPATALQQQWHALLRRAAARIPASQSVQCLAWHACPVRSPACICLPCRTADGRGGSLHEAARREAGAGEEAGEAAAGQPQSALAGGGGLREQAAGKCEACPQRASVVNGWEGGSCCSCCGPFQTRRRRPRRAAAAHYHPRCGWRQRCRSTARGGPQSAKSSNTR